MGKWQETVGEGFGTGRKRGTSRKHNVVDERNGRSAGHHTEHWDGSQDATATPGTVRVTTTVQDERD